MYDRILFKPDIDMIFNKKTKKIAAINKFYFFQLKFLMVSSIFFHLNSNAFSPFFNSFKQYQTFDLKSKFIIDTTSKFYRINKKLEKWFIYIPVPLYSYSSEGGNLFGLAKFNLFNIRADSITNPSRLSGVFSSTTKGRINFSVSAELVFKKNKTVVLNLHKL